MRDYVRFVWRENIKACFGQAFCCLRNNGSIHLSLGLWLVRLNSFIQCCVWSINKNRHLYQDESQMHHRPLERRMMHVYVRALWFADAQMFPSTVWIYMFCLVAIFMQMLYDACDLFLEWISERKACRPRWTNKGVFSLIHLSDVRLDAALKAQLD